MAFGKMVLYGFLSCKYKKNLSVVLFLLRIGHSEGERALSERAF